ISLQRDAVPFFSQMRSAPRPEFSNPAYSIASAVGLGTDPLSSLTAQAGYQNSNDEQWLRIAGLSVLAGTAPTRMEAAATPCRFTYTVQPFEKVEAYLTAQVVQGTADSLRFKAVRDFLDKLNKVTNKPSEARELVENTAKEPGYKLDTMTTLK